MHGGMVLLMDMIERESMEVKVDLKNWQEAVQKGGELLLKVGAIEESYIRGMIQDIREYGPYVVITKGVAIPHTRPERGALRTGMSLLTLKEPVPFGHDRNDPVSLVLCFSTRDDTGHLSMLSRLAELLEDDSFIRRLVASETVEEIVKVLGIP